MNDETIANKPPGSTGALLIKDLLHMAMRQSPTGDIVYAERSRYDYATLHQRIHRLGAALSGLGLRPGMTVGVMDWDTPRYLECFFAIPMLGAVLHTINIRLSPEQILYTINHAEDDFILVNAEFLPVLEKLRDRVDPGKKLILLNDAEALPATPLAFAGEYETLLAAAPPHFTFPDFDENTRATTLLYNRHHRPAQRRVFQPPPIGAAYAGSARGDFRRRGPGAFEPRRCLYAADADVPCACVGHAVSGHHARNQAGLPRPLCA